MTQFCRTCLEIIVPGEQFHNLDGQPNDESEQIKLQLESIVPQITLNVVQDPVICTYCVDTLNNAFNFKSKCIQTEEKIYDHILETDGPSHSIDISRVIFTEKKKSVNCNNEEIACEVEVFEEKVLPTSFELPPEFLINCDNGSERNGQVYIKAEPPDLQDVMDSNNVNFNTSTMAEDDSTEDFRGFEINSQLPTLAAYSCVESADPIPIEPNKQSLTDKEVPCPEVLPSAADVVPKSLKQRSKLACALQGNYKTRSSSTIQTRSRSNHVSHHRRIYSNSTRQCKTYYRRRKTHQSITPSSNIKSLCYKECENVVLTNNASKLKEGSNVNYTPCEISVSETQVNSSTPVSQEPYNTKKQSDKISNSHKLKEVYNKETPSEKSVNKIRINIINKSCEILKAYSIQKNSDKILDLCQFKEEVHKKNKNKIKVNSNIHKQQEVHNKEALCEKFKNKTMVYNNPCELQEACNTNEYHNKTLNSSSCGYKDVENKAVYEQSENKKRVNGDSSKLHKPGKKKLKNENKKRVNGDSSKLHKPGKKKLKKSENKTKRRNTSFMLQGFYNIKDHCDESKNKAELCETQNTKVCSEKSGNQTEFISSKLKKNHRSSMKEHRDKSNSITELNRSLCKLGVAHTNSKRKRRVKSKKETEPNNTLSEFQTVNNIKKQQDKSEHKAETNSSSYELETTCISSRKNHHGNETELNSSSCELKTADNLKNCQEKSENQNEPNSSSCDLETTSASSGKNLHENEIVLNSISCDLKTSDNNKKYSDKSEKTTEPSSSSCGLEETPTSSGKKLQSGSVNETQRNNSSCKLNTAENIKKRRGQSKNKTEPNSNSCDLKTSDNKKYSDKSEKTTEPSSSSCELEETPTSSRKKLQSSSVNETQRNNSSCKLKTADNIKKRTGQSKYETEPNSSSCALYLTRPSIKRKHRQKSETVNSSSCKLEATRRSSRKKHQNDSRYETELNGSLSQLKTPDNTKKRRAESKNGTKSNISSIIRKKHKNNTRNKTELKRSKLKTTRSSITKKHQDKLSEYKRARNKEQHFIYGEHNYSSLPLDVNLEDDEESFFICDECDYKTGIITNLQHHIMIHSNDKRFKCKYCRYKTTLKSNLARHKLIHTGDKPYRCQLCEFSSAWKQSLQVHVKTVH